MADSVQNRRNQQTYLRQIQIDKSEKKRDLIKSQNEDIKSVREYYKAQAKQVEEESAAAVSHIKEEARELAEQERQERLEQRQETEQKRAEQREEAKKNSYAAVRNSTEKKNFFP